MTAPFLPSAEVKRRVLAKPEPVQVALRILAVKISLDADAPMETDEEHAAWLQAALEEWDQTIMPAVKLCRPGATEEQFAEAMIARLRSDQKEGWGAILRGNAS